MIYIKLIRVINLSLSQYILLSIQTVSFLVYKQYPFWYTNNVLFSIIYIKETHKNIELIIIAKCE